MLKTEFPFDMKTGSKNNTKDNNYTKILQKGCQRTVKDNMKGVKTRR